MPSLAQRYGQGLLSGLEIQERQRRLKEGELTDEFMRERIEDMRFKRKQEQSLLAQTKKTEEEQAKRQEIITDTAIIEAGGLRTGPQFMRSILAGEETPPETKERLTSIMDYDPTLTLEQQMGVKPPTTPWWTRKYSDKRLAQMGITREQLEQYRGMQIKTGGISGLSPAFMATHEPDPLKPGKMRPLGKSVQERTKEWREKQKTHQKEVAKYVAQFHENWGIAKEKKLYAPPNKEEYWKLWRESIPSEFQYDVGVKLGVREPFLEESEKAEIRERKFYGATSYEEVETTVADMSEPKKSEILKQAREFFGVK